MKLTVDGARYPIALLLRVSLILVSVHLAALSSQKSPVLLPGNDYHNGCHQMTFEISPLLS